MIRIGVGGWTYAPWRGVFYPPGLPQARELEYASQRLTSIEINGTFYGSQKPESFRRWAAETPDDFVFSVKGPRFATHRKVLAEAGESIERFFSTGVRDGNRFRLSPDHTLAIGGQFEACGIIEREILIQYGLRPDDYVVDVGCGSGRLAKPLADYLRGPYLGIDVVPERNSASSSARGRSLRLVCMFNRTLDQLASRVA